MKSVNFPLCFVYCSGGGVAIHIFAVPPHHVGPSFRE
jgi:hypothetical protein